MNPYWKATRLFLGAAAALLWLVGCGQQAAFETIGEQDDPVYRRAKDLYVRGMQNEALENFLKLIQMRNGNAPESHLEAGNIYLNHLRDPVSAIYYFKRYKALLARSDAPDASDKISLVDDLIKTATKEFAANFDAKVYQDPLERLKLLDAIQDLRSENEVLKDQLSTARKRLNGLTAESASPARAVESGGAFVAREPTRTAAARRVEPEPPARGEGTYTVRSGDSLYKIARTVYGDSSRWQEILDANRGVIPDAGNLKVGTTIVLP